MMRILAVLLLVAALVTGCGGDDDDLNTDGAGNDADDDTGNDDSADDDSGDDDADDDTWPPLPDDDSADDDTVDPWSEMTATGPSVGSLMGTSTQMSNAIDAGWERDFEIEHLLQAGLLRLRASVDWGDVEPQDDNWTWEESDHFVNLIVDAGLQFDGRMSYGVHWAQPDGLDSSIDPAVYADFAWHVADRYCDRVKSWELWNEENMARFWDPEPDPAAYGSLLKAFYTAVKDACPDAQVVFGGLSCFETDMFSDGLYYFIERVFQAHPDIADDFDVMAIHPYTFLQQTSPEWYVGDPVEGFWPSLPGQIEITRQRLENIGAAGKPIWLTEWGWPSLLIGNETQARFFDRGALLSIAAGVGAVDWYTFWNKDGTSSLPTEDYFGLYTYPGAPGGPVQKPAFRHAVALTTLLGATHYAGDLAAALEWPGDRYALAFADEATGTFTLAAWVAEDIEESVLVPCPTDADAYTVFDGEGEAFADGSCGEGASLVLSRDVRYVRFE